MNEISGCCPAQITWFDEERARTLMRGAKDGWHWLPFAVRDGHSSDLLVVRFGDPPPGTKVRHLSVDMANELGKDLPQHVYAPTSDPEATSRHRAAAKGAIERITPPQPAPFDGGTATVFEAAILDLLAGAFSLPAFEVRTLFAEVYGHAPSLVPAHGTWPAGVLADAVDAEHAESLAAEKRSDEARARIAEQHARIVTTTLGETGLDGILVPYGKPAPIGFYDHLGHVHIPPTLQVGSSKLYLWEPAPGEWLPADVAAPRDLVISTTAGRLQGLGLNDGLAGFVREARQAFGCVDRRPIAEAAFQKDGRQTDLLIEMAKEKLSQHQYRTYFRTFAPSYLVRGLLIHPTTAAQVIRDALGIGEFIKPAPVTDVSGRFRWGDIQHDRGSWEHVEMGGTVGMNAKRVPEEPAPPVRDASGDWIEPACIYAAEGRDHLLHSPGACLPEVQPTLLAKVKALVTADPWAKMLSTAMDTTAKYSSEDLCKMVNADVKKTSDTSRIKALVTKAGWEKREVEQAGVRSRVWMRP